MKIRRMLVMLALLSGLLASGQETSRPPKERGRILRPDLVEITTLDSSIRLDIRYATENNFLKKAVYAEARAFLQGPAARALVRVHRSLARQGYGILVFDGYRPWSVTKLFWDLTPKDKRVFAANPAKGSRHNRGAAVDVTLFNLASGEEVDMGTAYDEMSERSFVTSMKGPAISRGRRTLLREAMENEGFFVNPWEWWHFDYKDWRAYGILDIPFSKFARPAPPESGASPSMPRP